MKATRKKIIKVRGEKPRGLEQPLVMIGTIIILPIMLAILGIASEGPLKKIDETQKAISEVCDLRIGKRGRFPSGQEVVYYPPCGWQGWKIILIPPQKPVPSAPAKPTPKAKVSLKDRKDCSSLASPITKKGGSKEQNGWIACVWWEGKDDPKLRVVDFIMTLEAESGLNPDAVSPDGKYHGFCQLDDEIHRAFVQDLDNFNNPQVQLNYCWGVWKDALKKEAKDKGSLRRTFGGTQKIAEMKKRFDFKRS